MVRALLDRGFSANARAIVTGCHALTPVQCAVLLGIQGACAVLKAHPDNDLSITITILGVHALHFAAAHCRLDLLQLFGIPMSAVPTTAVGHTLLHVACLPEDIGFIQRLSPKIVDSIHDFCQLPPAGPVVPDGDQAWDASGDIFASWDLWLKPEPTLEDEVSNLAEEAIKQREMCMYLIRELGPSQIAAKDMHGNTPLHYLASVLATNKDLIAWMRNQEGGDHVWHSAANAWGHTPKDLLDDAELAVKNNPDGYPNYGGRVKGPDMFNSGV